MSKRRSTVGLRVRVRRANRILPSPVTLRAIATRLRERPQLVGIRGAPHYHVEDPRPGSHRRPLAQLLLEKMKEKGGLMNIVRFDPFRELEAMTNRLNRLFDSSLVRRDDPDAFSGWAPAVDVEETDKEYRVKADLPEVTKNDVKVSIEDGVLTIEGERKQEKEEKNKKFHRVERLYGKFVRGWTFRPTWHRIRLPRNSRTAS